MYSRKREMRAPNWMAAGVVLATGCGSLDPLTVTGCRADSDCVGDRLCVLGTCRQDALDAGPPDMGQPSDAGAANEHDAGADGGTGADVIACSGQPEVVTTFECTTYGELFCPILVDGDTDSSFGLECATTPGAPGCTQGGRVSQADLILRLPEPTVVRGLRLLADWFSKRPVDYEVWAGTSSAAPGEPGTTRVARAVARPPPWLCVDGFECDYYTPTACCRNGRDHPINIQSARSDHPKWDVVAFDGVVAEYWTLRVLNTDDPTFLLLFEVELLSEICVETSTATPPGD